MLQAAAAVVLFAAGMAVSQLDIDYSSGAVTVRARSAAPVEGIRTVSNPPPAQNVAAPPEVVRIDQAGDRGRSGAPPSPSSVDSEQILQRVRAMIDQSEKRQQRELAVLLSQVSREVETQHTVDMQRIQQDFGRQQDATMEYLVRTSGGAK